MSKNLRISLFGLLGAFAGFALQGCFAPQPTPECSVTITAAALGLAPYYVKLTKVSGTGACADLTHLRTGLTRFRTKASGGDFTLAVKASPVVDPYLGKDFSANQDPTNDCVNEDDCQGDSDPKAACVNLLADGGVELFDGTPIAADGTVTQADGGTYSVDPANECGPVDEPITRSDPADPKGSKLNAIGKMPQFPTKNACAVTDFTGGSQDFQEEVLSRVDGVPQTLPAITYKIEYTNFNVINSTRVPGTAFTTDIKYTQGPCVAEYKGVGFWPEIACSNAPSEGALVESAECDPNADLDAGRVTGSGINPDFKPKCDTALGVCVPTVDVTTIK